MSLAAGSRLGPFEILVQLGAGGMGEVYRARDTRLGREVAVKVLPEHLARDPQAVTRFEREARAVAALSHPNILALFDVGAEGGVTFAVTELLEGETLRSRLAGGALPLDKAVEAGAAVADGLAAAHAKGITHRDLKPENIFLTADGRVKILDFGLARYAPVRATEDATSAPTETAPGTILGTVGYMSPEQVRGEAVGPASDIFSLGCVLYEMVTGRRAFARAAAGETLAAILWDEPPPAGAAVEIDRLIARCLEKSPAQRFQSAQDLAFALRAAGKPEKGLIWPRLRGVAAVIAVLLALATSAYWISTRRSRPIDSLAVLPFVNTSSDPDTEYLSEGISESLITSLSRVARLKVKSRDTVFRYKGQDKDVQAVGRELGVRAVLKGRLVQRGESLAISAELVDTSDGTLLWRDQYNRRLADILGVEQEISKEIAEQLRLKLSGEERRQITASTGNPEAHRLYLQGRYFWNRRTEESLKKSIEYFQHAIDKDPGYALAWAGLADSFLVLGIFSWLPPQDALPNAKTAAARAIQLQETLAEPHASLARTKTLYDWDWTGAEREYRRAIELSQQYGTAHHWYADHLLAVGRLPEAVGEMRRAREVEPLALMINAQVGYVHFYARQYEEAVQESRKAVEMDPAFVRPHLVLGMTYAVQRRQKEATAELQQAINLSQRASFDLAFAGSSFALLGQRDEARKLFQELVGLSRKRFVASYMPALILANLGERDRAFEYFEKALQERSVPPWSLRNPLLDGMRPDPRFQSLLQRMGLPP